jgi:phosphohistidine phosphatase SixA
MPAPLLVVARHAEPRKAELDPELTSAGHQMARELGAWLADRHPGPWTLWHSPARRCDQTAALVAEQLALAAPPRALPPPDAPEPWSRLLHLLTSLSGPVLMVGHHTTLQQLVRAHGPPPSPLSLARFASAVALTPTPAGGWAPAAVWPGRLA